MRRKMNFIVTISLSSIGCLLPEAAHAQSGPTLQDILNTLNGIQAQIAHLPPSWSRKLPAEDRFVVLAEFNNEAVLDRETGLVWERSPDTVFLPWIRTIEPGTGFPKSSALTHCYERVVGGRKGWRLPRIEELSSLIDTTQFDPALPSGHPFLDVRSCRHCFYWSVTTRPVIFWDQDRPNIVDLRAFRMFFTTGNVSWDAKNNSHLTWCVRGGNAHDGQSAVFNFGVP